MGLANPSTGIEFYSGLIIAIKGRFRNTAAGHSEYQIDRLVSDPFDGNYLDGLAGNDAAQLSTMLDIFQNRHYSSVQFKR